MREPSDRNDIANQQRLEKNFVAGYERDPLCTVERSQLRAGRAVDRNRTQAKAVQSRDCTKERRLAGAIASQERYELSGGDAGLDIAQKRAPADVERHAPQLDHRRLETVSRRTALAGRRYR